MRLLRGVAVATLIAAGLTFAAPPPRAQAQQEFPAKPVRVIVGFPPGSPADILARLLGQKLAETWEKPLVEEFAAVIKSEIPRWAKLIKEVGIKAQ